MESSNFSDTETLQIDKITDDLSETSDNSADSEKSEPMSIGKLQHKVKMLSIKVLEKDIEIRNLKAEATTAKWSNSSEIPDISSIQSQWKINQSNQVIESEKLRQFLIEHEFSDPCHTFITREVYNSMKLKKTELNIIDLIKFRHFQLCDSLQDILKPQFKSTISSSDIAVQTDKPGFDQISFEKQALILKEDNEYLAKQLDSLEQKLHSLEKVSGRQKEDLKNVENERARLLERAIKAEECQQGLEEELKKCKQLSENRLPLSLFEQLQAFELSRREQGTSELKKDLGKLQLERDDLVQQLNIVETENKRLKEDLHSVCSRSLTGQPTDVLTKTRVISLEMQLNAANVAKTDALRQVDQIKEKFEAASKAIYELDAARKVEVSQLEAQLSMLSQKLAAYERLEAELDRAIEHSAPNEGDSNVMDGLFHLETVRDRNGNPLLPTLASRRLEHCIQLAHRTAAAESAKRKLKLENDELKSELEIVKGEARRKSELLADMDRPTNSLAAALVERNKEISNLQYNKRKLEEKLQQLYNCTKDILAERNAILMDLKGVRAEMNQQKAEQKSTQIRRKQLPRKICNTRS